MEKTWNTVFVPVEIGGLDRGGVSGESWSDSRWSFSGCISKDVLKSLNKRGVEFEPRVLSLSKWTHASACSCSFSLPNMSHLTVFLHCIPTTLAHNLTTYLKNCTSEGIPVCCPSCSSATLSGYFLEPSSAMVVIASAQTHSSLRRG